MQVREYHSRDVFGILGTYANAIIHCVSTAVVALPFRTSGGLYSYNDSVYI